MNTNLTINECKEKLIKRLDELRKVLDCSVDDKWDEAYDEYCRINNVLNQQYRDENIEEFEKFFYEHIYAKDWNQIDPDILDLYSDWHKDMFGYRPRSTEKDW